MIDPYSKEAQKILDDAERLVPQMNAIIALRRKDQDRKNSAERMRMALQRLALDIYDYPRDGYEVSEGMDVLAEAMRQDSLTPPERRDVWAWVAAIYETQGWG